MKTIQATRPFAVTLALFLSLIWHLTPAQAQKKAVKAPAVPTDAALRAATVRNIERDDLRGEDPEIRRAALAALGNRAGTVVVMNPQTGQIYSVVNQAWGVRNSFKPCSTIKLVTGLAGLTEGLIDPLQQITVNSSGSKYTLSRALAASNNEYFQGVGSQLGFRSMLDYARALGLGKRTGINMTGESAGRLPAAVPAYGVGRMSSHGDGFLVTPLQLATMISAIGNGGYFVTPRVSYNGRFQPGPTRQASRVSLWALDQMMPGLSRAVRAGTASRAYDAGNEIAGKTGSCKNNGWVGLFTSFAPANNPEVAVVVVTRGTSERGKYAAAVAGQIHRLLKGRPDNAAGSWAGAGNNRSRVIKTRTSHAPADDDSDASDTEEADDDRPEPESLANGGARQRRARPNRK